MYVELIIFIVEASLADCSQPTTYRVLTTSDFPQHLFDKIIFPSFSAYTLHPSPWCYSSSKYLASVPSKLQLSRLVVSQPRTGSLHNTAATLALCKLNCNTEVTRTCIRSAHCPPPATAAFTTGYPANIWPVVVWCAGILFYTNICHNDPSSSNNFKSKEYGLRTGWRTVPEWFVYKILESCQLEERSEDVVCSDLLGLPFTFLSIMTSQFFASKISYKGSINWVVFW